MPLLSLPGEIFIKIAENIPRKDDLFAFISVNRRLYNLLLQNLHTAGAQETFKDCSHLDLHSWNIFKFVTIERFPPIALSWAALQGNEKLVRSFLAKGASPKLLCYPQSSYVGESAVYYAARGGNATILKLFLEYGAGIDTKHFGYSPLTWAIHEGDEAMVKLLLDNGADVDGYDDPRFGRSPPIQKAINMGHPGIVKIIFDAGCDINLPSNGIHGINRAVYSGNLEIVKMFLEKGVSIGITAEPSFGGFDLSPLHTAVENSDIPMISLLLENGAEINGIVDGISPLQSAVRVASADVVRLLLDKGADINYYHDEYSMLHIASYNEEHGAEVAKVLISRGADVNSQGRFGDTPIRRAVLRSQYQFVKTLLKGKTDIDIEDNFGRGAFDDSVSRMDLRMAMLIASRTTGGLVKRIRCHMDGCIRISYRRARNCLGTPFVDKHFILYSHAYTQRYEPRGRCDFLRFMY